jgi:DNA repair exonuclease SbcCD ATPase subunit
MSGPKKSKWEIRQEIIEQRRREKARKRAKQVNEIKERIKLAQNKLNSFSKIYPDISQNIINLVNEWIRDINLNGDLRDAFKKIRGIENYLNKQEKILKSKQEKIDAKKEMERIKQEKIKNIVKSLETLKEDYKEILNDGILQRIELFKNAIKANPDNKKTLSQIEQFKQQLFKLQEEYEEKKYKTEYVADKFSKILNGDIKKNGDNLEISGNINGVPISVKLNYKNSNIDLDTPLDGSCKRGLEALQKSLNKENIFLGEIKVLRTGEILNRQYNQNKKRIKI